MSKELLDISREMLTVLQEYNDRNASIPDEDLVLDLPKKIRKVVNKALPILEAQTQKPQRYRIMSHGFGHDVNGNPTSRFRIFKVVDSETEVQIYYNDRRSQCGYPDHRCDHALYWLSKNTGHQEYRLISSTGSRSEDCINAIFEKRP